VAWVLWGGVLLALLARGAIHSHQASSLTTYLAGGKAWVNSKLLYTDWRGFVYPPVIAWFFGIFAHLPVAVAGVLWRAMTAAVFLIGLGALLRSGIFHQIPAALHGLVLVAALPLTIGNIDNAQANPLVAGLMMLSVAALQYGAWSVCAFAVALATMFKIYPIALGLLLCILRPKELWWRIAFALLVLAVAPFLVKDGHYVAGQYHAWWQSRLADDRFHYPMKDAPVDLWYVLVRLGNLPISERVYMGMQVLGGMGLAGFVWVRARRGADIRDNLAGLYLLVSIWMLLLGPATENQTYVVLGPAACLMAVQALAGPGRMGVRIVAFAAYGLLLAAAARNSLLPHLKGPIFMAIQPVGALVLLGAVLCDLRGGAPARARSVSSDGSDWSDMPDG
jgi:hypothetical protein